MVNNHGRKNMSPRPGWIRYGRVITGWFTGVSLGRRGGGRGGRGLRRRGLGGLLMCGLPCTVTPAAAGGCGK